MSEWSRRLGPRVRFGTFGGLSRPQTLLLFVGTFAVLEVLSVSQWGLFFAIPVGGWFARMILKHKHGMPKADWMIKALAYHTDRRKRWQARPVGRRIEQLPREFGDVRLVPVKAGSKTVGMFRERHTLAAAAPLELHSLGLFDPSVQAGRQDAFRRILDNLERDADDPLFAFSLTVRRVPHGVGADRANLLEHVDDPGSPQVQSMLQVLDETQEEDQIEFYVAMRRSVEGADGDGRLVDRAAVQLADRLGGVVRRFERADIAIKTEQGLYEPEQLSKLVKESVNPFGFEARDRRERALGAYPNEAWPDSVDRRHIEYVELDGAFHATLWIRGFPAEEVGPGWIKPLTLDCEVPAIAVTTVFKPEKRATALQMVKRRRRRSMAFRIFRSRQGVEEEEEQSERMAYLDRMADEMVNRGASAIWSETYATVSARSPEELADALEVAGEACADCGLVAVPMRYVQGQAFAFTLPLCRGLMPERGRL